MARLITLILLGICSARLTAQTWQAVGPNGFSGGQASQMSIALSNNNTPYVAYSLVPNGRKETVKKFNGTDWELVGVEGLSAGEANYLSLAFDGATPYLLYGDKAAGDKATVKKFDGTNWQTVGSEGFTPGLVSYCGIAINNGTPYIVYIDGANNSTVTVQKFSGGAWQAVGASFGGNYSSYTSIAFNGDVPYVAFQDIGAGGKATVKKFDGSNWVDVGSAGFSAGTANDVRIAFNGNVAYVIYSDNGSSNKAVVKKFNGTTWETVGAEGFSAGGAAYTSITFDGGTPYAAYTDATQTYKCTVKKFNGTTWETVGTEGISSGIANFTNIIAGGAYIYLFYSSNADGAFVKRWAGTLSINISTFDATAQKSNAALHWQATQNTGFNHFEIEKNEGTGFKHIASVTFKQAGAYSYVDINAFGSNTGTIYYRLKLVDNDGAYTYSNAVAVKNNSLDNLVAAYPNPFTSKLFINGAATNIQLVDASGRTVLKQTVSPAQQQTLVQNIGRLPAGIYMLTINGPGGKQHIKLIKQ